MILLYVEWDDSCTKPGWGDAVDGKPQRCCTFGIQVRRDKKSVTLASGYNNGTQFLDQITIPMAVVKKIRRIESGKP